MAQLQEQKQSTERKATPNAVTLTPLTRAAATGQSNELNQVVQKKDDPAKTAPSEAPATENTTDTAATETATTETPATETTEPAKAEGDKKAPEFDGYSPSSEAQAIFQQLKATQDEKEAAALITQLSEMGVPIEHIKDWVDKRKENKWWQAITTGTWTQYGDEGAQKWKLSVSAEGLTWENAITKVSAGKNDHGAGVTVTHDDVKVVAGAKVGADGYSGSGATVTVGGKNKGDATTTVTATHETDPKAGGHTGKVGVTHDTGKGTVVTTNAKGGVDSQGGAVGGGDVTVKSGETTVAAGADYQGTGVKTNANVAVTHGKTKATGNVTHDGEAGLTKGSVTVTHGDIKAGVDAEGGGGSAGASANATFKAGDKVTLRMKGSWSQKDGGDETGKAEASGDIGNVKNAGADYSHTKKADGQTIHNIGLFVDELPIGQLVDGKGNKLGVKGNITVGQDVDWQAEATVTLVLAKDSELTISAKAGQVQVKDVNALIQAGELKMTGDGQASYATIMARGKSGNTQYDAYVTAAGARVPGMDPRLAIAMGGGMTLGDPSKGTHKFNFMYAAMRDPKFAHYAKLSYQYLQQNGLSVGGSGEVLVAPGHPAYETMWKLQTDVGFQVAKGHKLAFKFGVVGGENIAFTAGAQWAWDQILTVDLTGSFPVSGEDWSAGLDLTIHKLGGTKVYLRYNQGQEGTLEHKFGDNGMATVGVDIGGLIGM
ncbi:MAG: hypothetical protein KC561_05125 [Myxococcales bacterium]|nr:hypothetical protein [Myxococcales bacterium]